MSAHQQTVFHTVPLPRVKKEVLLDDDDTVQCTTCWKGFVSQLALNNHVRMEHMDLYASGNEALWTACIEKPDQKKSIKTTDDILACMSPSSVLTLASDDVSYLIVKTGDVNEMPKRQKKEKKKTEKKVEVKPKPASKKELQPITGPFECLQPSTLVADGTCHQIFFSCCDYSIHFRDEHNRRRKGLKCQVCEKPLAASEANSLPYPCEMCGTGYQTARELSDHTAIAHVKLKPFQCSVCLKRFTQQGGLMQHMRMHTGDRPFPCTYCPKAFTQKSGLDQHLRIHTKVKPYRCVVCSKTFCQSVHLKQHMRTHTNVAPFQCGICNKRFKQSSHLNYHLKNHNPASLTEEQRTKFTQLIGMINESGNSKGNGTVTNYVVKSECQQVENEDEQVVYEFEEVENQYEQVENECEEVENESEQVENEFEPVEVAEIEMEVEEGEVIDSVQVEPVDTWEETIVGT